MKRLLSLLCVLVFLLATTSFGETLTVLHLNDTHAHLLPYGPKDATGHGTWGGMARVATLVGMNKMTEPNAMMFHSGDFCVGDFMFQEYLGIPELQIMKQAGFDAVELGNHEFDLYPSTLKYMLNQAGYPSNGIPVLCANLDMSADPEMAYFVQPYMIKQCGSVKVGIFGLLTDFTNSGSNVVPLSVIPPLNVAQAWIDTLKIGHGCDVVLLISHLGVDMDQMVAATTNGINVIVGGHTHTLVNQPLTVGNTLILQAGEFGHYLGKLHLNVEGGLVTGWDYQLITVDATVPEEPTLAGLLGSLAAGIEADPRFGPVYSQPVARAAIDIDRDFGHGLVMDNPMGNLISDAYRKVTGTDIAIQPQGFINQQLWAGPIVGDEVFQSVPYGFDQVTGLGLKVATFKTDGASLIAGLEFSVYNLPYLEDFLLHASNMSFAYDMTKPAGMRVDYASILIGGKPINPAGVYTVTVPDGVIPFLSQIPGFNMTDIVVTDKYMYSVVKEYLAAKSPVAYYREGRILNLEVLAEPVDGAKALADLVTVYEQNGSIRRGCVADNLRREFLAVARTLEYHRVIPALMILQAIKLQVALEAKLHRVSDSDARTLKYLIVQLSASIKRSAGIAWKGTGDDEVEAIVPQTFELGQNYPNPFNPSTRIEFSLPSTQQVRLDIYNILGEQVTTLVDGEMSAGQHSIEWNSTDSHGQGVASGIYFYRLTAGDKVATRKMMLVK
ncbi:MAG: 5'-nucleotidase C-terminal domain-containing protein [Candidatus Zixiibacteriota bacterium]